MQTVQGQPVQLIQVPDAEALAQRTLSEFLACANASIKCRGRFYLAISGGNTPKRFYQLLSESRDACRLSWEAIDLFWVDERAVEPENEASNYRLAAETFLKTVPIPAGNVHRMCGEAEDLNKAARDYEQTLQEVFGLSAGQLPLFDLILLGMGSDGHIASLKPSSYALFDTEALTSTVFQMEDDWSRLTLTVPVLRAARQLIVLVSGAEKAPIMQTVFTSEPDELKYPAHALWPVLDKVLWIMDAAAGKLLSA